MLKIQYIFLLILILILIFSKHPKKKETFETPKIIYPLTKPGADEIASIGCSPDQHSATHQHGNCTCPANYKYGDTWHTYKRAAENQYCVHSECTSPKVYKEGECITCPGGQEPNNAHDGCAPCPVGWKKAEGSGICTQCDAYNEYQPSPGQTSCKTIPPGTYKIDNSTVGYCKLETYHRPNEPNAEHTITSKDSGAVGCYDATREGDWVFNHSNRRIKLASCKCSDANCSGCIELDKNTTENKCNIEFWKNNSDCTTTEDTKVLYNPVTSSGPGARAYDSEGRYSWRYNYIKFDNKNFDRDNELYERKWRTDGFKRIRFSFNS